MIRKRFITVSLLLGMLMVALLAMAGGASASIGCTTVCYVDDTGSDANDGTTPATAFATIQMAIDTVDPGGEIRILPGTYNQDEKNGMDPVTGGAGGNDFNIFVNKADITLQGVTAADVDITTAAGALAIITPKRSVPTFGDSAMFIQADGVTVQGVKFVAKNGGVQADKTVEIIGNDVTIDATAFDVTSNSVGIYISDFSYDSGTDTSTVSDFTYANNHFTSTDQTGSAIQVASGAGWPDNVGTRTISGNTFTNLDDALAFAGAGSAGWRLYPVGSADITGNTFSQIKRRHVMAWGNYPIANPTALGYADPDWCGILANNTFDKATMLWQGTTACPAGQPRRWDAASGNPAPYDWFRNVAGIYSAIQQYGIGKAVAGDLLQILPGTYPENVTLDKSMTLSGAGEGTNPLVDTILEGTGRTGSGIFINNNVTDVTIEYLRVQNFNLSAAAGVYGNLSNNGLTVQHVTTVNNGLAGNNGGGIYMNGPVDDVLIDNVTATNNRNRGIVIWNGFKTNITITNNTVTGNNCCGIELQDGTASGVTVTGNTVTGNLDSGMAFIGLMAGAGPNVIANNTVTNNGRFGIEIKLPNGTGLATGDGSIVVEDNDVSLSPAGTLPLAEERDIAGIAVIRRGLVVSENNVDIPTGVIVRDNTVSGYQQNNASSDSTGFGIVVEGTNMHVSGNTLNNNDVGVQVQAGHTPYVANTNTDGNQTDLADLYFGRGNSPVGCAAIGVNTFSGNTVDTRNVNAGGGIVTNVDTSETFCSIQAAVSDSDTLNGHTIEVSAGVYAENVTVNKSLTINGANANVSPNQPGNLVNPNPARGPESEVTVTGGGSAFKVQAADVIINGFKFTDSNVAQADISLPIIGAGGNFGGDAPGVYVINNLFYQTNKTLVYFNGPSLMAGGVVNDNRAQDPDRPDTGCVGATAPSGCGHQLFNLWKTDDLSFQGNVTVAAPASGDRIRTLNISGSTDVTINGNYVRYTCTYTCFTIAADTSGDVTVTSNDLVTDVGNVLQIHSSWATTGATINVHHNLLTTGNDFPIVVDDLNADLDNVSFNRNAISGTYHVRNGTDNLVTPGTETVDATCNWWGSAGGPTPANFFGPVDYTPWLFSNDLDGDCYVPGTITVEKQTTPDGDTTEFEFDPSWSATNFMLADGDSEVSPALNPNDGPFSVAEVNLPMFWSLDNAECTNGVTTADPSSIPLADGESWTCTFENSYTPPPPVLIYISPNVKNGVVDGVVYNDQDILVNTMGTSDWEMFFDGSTFGITKNLTDFTFDSAGCLLMTFNGNQKLSGVTYTPQDVAKFCPTVPNNYTAGTFSMYFDGSDVGLTGGAEIIDALEILPDGRLVISTKGNAKVPGTNVINLKAQKNDMLVFDYITYGPSTTGTWDLYFNNTDVAGLNKENIISSYILAGDIYTTFWADFTVGDEVGDFNDIVVIHDDNTVDVFWDADDWGFSGRIHGLHINLNP